MITIFVLEQKKCWLENEMLLRSFFFLFSCIALEFYDFVTNECVA